MNLKKHNSKLIIPDPVASSVRDSHKCTRGGSTQRGGVESNLSKYIGSNRAVPILVK